ncbi:MAG: LamG domain-containing protein, partial [Planctomycetes bacterium]|nr:LamG domain-containing protein [Planctomycetota bacterium]
ADSTRRATHRVRAVVQLVRRKLSTVSSAWTTAQAYTVLQWGNDEARFDLTNRIEGPVQFQGPLQVCPTYPYDCRPFSGAIDEVAVFNKTLGDSDMTNLYAARLSTDNSARMAQEYNSRGPLSWWRLNEAAGATTAADQMGLNPGTIVGPTLGVSGSPSSPAQNAANFDGANDHVSIGTFSSANDNKFSIIAWVKPDTTNQDLARILCKSTGIEESDTYWELSAVKVSGNLRLRFRLKTLGSTSTLTATGGTLAAGSWSLVGATYDGLVMRLYKDGSQVGSALKLGNVSTSSQARVYIGDSPPGSARSRYLRDLEAKRAAGGIDMRPLSGPVGLPTGRISAVNRSLLEQDLKLTTTSVSATDSGPLTMPGPVSTYQLYAGGKSYAVPVVVSALSSVTLKSDPISNPLGVFYASGAVSLYDNVTINGTLIVDNGSTASKLQIYGRNVQLQGANLPSIDGSTQALQLPAAIVRDDMNVASGAGATITGLVAVGARYYVQQSGTSGTSLTHTGKLFCRKLALEGRNEWVQSESWWQDRLSEFLNQWLTAGTTPNPYFPEYLRSRNLAPEPPTVIKSASTPVTYHWHNWSNPLFVPHPNDTGLRWNLIQWLENP